MKYFILISVILIGCNSDKAKMKELIKQRDGIIDRLKIAKINEHEILMSIYDSFQKNRRLYLDSMYMQDRDMVKMQYYSDKANQYEMNFDLLEMDFTIANKDSLSRRLNDSLSIIQKQISDLKLINSTN